MNNFHPITDQQLIDRLAGLVAPLFDQPWDLRGETLVRKSWVAVPVERGRNIEVEDAPRIATAIRRHTSVACYAVATEPAGDEPMAYEVPVTEDGLLDFSHECFGLNFILMPADLTFALLFTSEDYNLYAGPKDFVESVLGTSIAAAREAFRIYADDPWWQGILLDVHRYYDSLDRNPTHRQLQDSLTDPHPSQMSQVR